MIPRDLLQPHLHAIKTCAFLTVLVTSLLGGDAENAWPQFHGPNRGNKSPDTNLLKSWPEGGPGRIWETAGIGEGYSTVAIAGNRIYTTGAVDGDCVITCLDMDGRKLWTKKNGKAWGRSYPGTRSTPTIAGDLLYHLSGIGNLVCLNAANADEVWSVNIRKQFGGRLHYLGPCGIAACCRRQGDLHPRRRKGQHGSS